MQCRETTIKKRRQIMKSAGTLGVAQASKKDNKNKKKLKIVKIAENKVCSVPQY